MSATDIAPARRPPGPSGLPILGLTLAIRKDALGTLRRVAHEYGDIVRLPVAFQDRIFLNHPDFIEQVLVIQQAKFHKSELTKRVTEGLLGQGLLISEGDFWRRQRRLAQPAFPSQPHQRIRRNNDGKRVQRGTSRLGARGTRASDLAAEMMALTLDVAVQQRLSSVPLCPPKHAEVSARSMSIPHALPAVMAGSDRR